MKLRPTTQQDSVSCQLHNKQNVTSAHCFPLCNQWIGRVQDPRTYKFSKNCCKCKLHEGFLTKNTVLVSTRSFTLRESLVEFQIFNKFQWSIFQVNDRSMSSSSQITISFVYRSLVLKVSNRPVAEFHPFRQC